MNYGIIKSYAEEKFKGIFHGKHIAAMIFFLESALLTKSLIPAKLGKKSKSSEPRHGVKRAHRLLKNKKITEEQMNQFLLTDFRNMIKHKSKLILTIDWTVIRGVYNFLYIALNLGQGQAVPIIFYGYKKGEMKPLQSQPKIEQEALQKIFKIIGTQKKVIIIGDRGFDGTATLQFIANHGYFYVIRATSGSIITFSNGKSRNLDYSLIIKGEKKLFKNIKYTEEAMLKTNLGVIWNKNQDEPWLLLSNMENYDVQGLANIYCLRWEIETMFKSMKNDIQGMQIKYAKLQHIDRWLRYLFLVTVLFKILSRIGIGFRKVDNIEKRYSMSSRIPKGQKHIFTFYNLALLIIEDFIIKITFFCNKFYFKYKNPNWILLA